MSGQQGAVHDVDDLLAGLHVATAQPVILHQDGGVTGIVFESDEFRRLCGVPEGHVEALRANGRNHMGRLADQEDAVSGEVPRHKAAHWEGPAWTDVADAPEFAMGLQLDLPRQLAIRHGHDFGSALPGAPSRPGSRRGRAGAPW